MAGLSLNWTRGPWALLLGGAVLVLVSLLAGASISWVSASLEVPSPLRELRLAAFLLLALGLLWWGFREAGGFLRLRRNARLRGALDSNGPVTLELIGGVRAWLACVERHHGPGLEPGIRRVEESLQHAECAAQVRQAVESEVLPHIDLAVEREIRSSALRLGVASSLIPLPLLDALLCGVFAVRLVRRVAELNGARPGLWGSLHLVREVAMAALTADLSQHAADAVSARIGSLVASTGQGLATAAILVRVGLWTQYTCQPVERERGGVGGLMARGAARGVTTCVREGVGRAATLLRPRAAARP